jgi:hypothetical protein
MKNLTCKPVGGHCCTKLSKCGLGLAPIIWDCDKPELLGWDICRCHCVKNCWLERRGEKNQPANQIALEDLVITPASGYFIKDSKKKKEKRNETQK